MSLQLSRLAELLGKVDGAVTLPGGDEADAEAAGRAADDTAAAAEAETAPEADGPSDASNDGPSVDEAFDDLSDG